MNWLKVLSAVFLLAMPGMAVAGWQARTSDDGALFYGHAVADPPELTLSCIGPSRGGVPRIQVGAHETATSPVFGFAIGLSDRLVQVDGNVLQRDDIAIWVNGSGFRLPRVFWGEMEGQWGVNVAMTDPLVGALRRADDLILGPLAGPHFRLTTDGLGEALAEVMRFCTAEYVRLGHVVPPGLSEFLPSAPTRSGGGFEAMANAAVASACSGGVTTEPGYILTGDIDGDAVTDVILDWGKVVCLNGARRPFCGASLCSADLYISQEFAKRGEPERTLALGIKLIPLSNGRQGISTGGSLASCHAAGRGDRGCTFISFWNGSSMELLK